MNAKQENERERVGRWEKGERMIQRVGKLGRANGRERASERERKRESERKC